MNTEREELERLRILSLEGGGLMGAFSASARAQFEEETGLYCIDHFDLIAGTSTGGTSAIGLGLSAPGTALPC